MTLHPRPGEATTGEVVSAEFRLTGFIYAAHEAGHMLGLGDEYEDAGHQSRTEVAALAGSAGVEQRAMDSDTSSVMSKGRDVLPAHYATFWEVLGRMTAGYLQPSEWKIGSA